jgi:hypothetical protein
MTAPSRTLADLSDAVAFQRDLQLKAQLSAIVDELAIIAARADAAVGQGT